MTAAPPASNIPGVKTSTRLRPPTELAYELLECWLLWRRACEDVQRAYERWCASAGAQARAAFEAYREAFDREEAAAAIYSASLGRIEAAESIGSSTIS
jgi:hypothetical protein